MKLALLSLPRLLPYGPALKLQSLIGKAVKEEKLPDVLILLQHPPTFTYGLRSPLLLEEEQKLVNTGAEIYKVRRGGQSTFHGPGQLVGYPILNLKRLKGIDGD